MASAYNEEGRPDLVVADQDQHFKRCRKVLVGSCHKHTYKPHGVPNTYAIGSFENI